MPAFSLLTHPWIPLKSDDGVRRVTYSELLSGDADAVEIIHPRDDMRFFTRMLLSAMTQALFPVDRASELQSRIDAPLSRQAIEKALHPHLENFQLTGPKAFLQWGEGTGDTNDTGRLFLDLPTGSRHLLFRPPSPYEALCPPCGAMALYGCQSFAASGGRGHSPGVRGAPPVTTLVLLPSVRQTVWANILTGEMIRSIAIPNREAASPWRTPAQSRDGNAIQLLEGLFWQPRSVSFVEAPEGHCSACGVPGVRLSARGFGPKSKVTGGFFQHPHTPFIRDTSPRAKRQLAPLYLRGERPAWTGLADMLGSLRGSGGAAPKQPHAAPVVQQWMELLQQEEVRLDVLFYATDKAKIASRVTESYTISFPEDGEDLIPAIRSLVELTEQTLVILRGALSSATATASKKAGTGTAEASVEFWQRTDPLFWDALEALMTGAEIPDTFVDGLRRTAIDLYDTFTDLIAMAGSHHVRVAEAKRQLRNRLYKLLPHKEADNAA